MLKLLQVPGSRWWFPILLLLITVVGSANAQCPIANTCSPAPGSAPSANWVFGMGIFNVNVNNGAINNTTAGASQGYQNYSCTIGANLTATVAYPISIQTNPNVNENVKVWIDYNNDGSFHATNELAFSSVNAKLHAGTFTIPATAVLGSPLRMRVSADNFTSPIPTPCSTPVYSQVEDYRITVSANTSAPTAEFSAPSTTTCSASVCFTDLSQNGPTSWLWNFGDPASGANNTSTLQNPCHTFSGPGTYTISLTAQNAVGSDIKIKTNYITYHTNIPVAATCTPNTINYCCGYGITNVNFGSGLLTNTSANGAAGYQDFTCTKSVTAIAGNTYPIALTSGANPQDTRVYIDLNNDGAFTGPNEMVLQVLNQVNPTGNITIPGTTFTNTPLRMRIISDEIGSTFNSCTGIQSGQAEDYTIRITPNPNPPVAQFTSNYASACDTIVQFTSQSTNAPTSWLWTFGDLASGALNTSTLPNPIHIYHSAGNYTVTLTATNANGNNTIIKTNYITVVKPCLNYCSSSGHTNTNLWISNVQFSNLNNTSTQATSGYSNFTSQAATLIQGSPAMLRVTRAGGLFSSSVSAWIDYNRNGIFETTERVMAVNALNGVATTSVLVPGSAPLGSTRMRVMTSGTGTAQTNPCLMNQFNMEVEDYTINIQTNQQPPVVDFTVTSQIICTNTAQFTDNSINVPTSWLWNFGDIASGGNNTSTLQNPTHVFSGTGQYTITLTATNTYGFNTITKTNYINYDPTTAYCTNVIMPATGTGPTATACNASIFDPGGPTGQYPNNANGTVTIAPAGASTITLTFSAFDLENGWDYLTIYDGPNASSQSLGSFTGTTIPPPIPSTGGALTLVFTSDGVGTRNGFAATWACTPITTKPVTTFKADFTNICTGVVPFQDQSTNSPTTWLWNFGDLASGINNTSTLQNPTHTYPNATPGAYTVTLISCNSFGCDTVVTTNYVNITVPCLTYCASNLHNNTGQWIKNVTFGGINNNSGIDPSGYGNFTYKTANVMLGTPTNPFSVTLGNNNGTFGYVAIWIDFNKDGIFQTTEKVFNGQATNTGIGLPISVAGNIVIPGNASTGVTRMRVIMSQNFNLTNPCVTGQLRAEAEDYAVNIQPNTLPPVANFTANLNTVCTGSVQFTDASLNGATSWSWDFGNGTTSTLQNPVATYSTTSPGNYTVILTVCKAGNCNTITKTNFVNINVPCLTYCASTGHTNTNQWISNFTMGTINNTTIAENNGYGNYTYLNNPVMIGSTGNTFSLTLGNQTGPFSYVAAWIDYNKDGIFQTTERVFNVQATSLGFGNPITASGSITIPGTVSTGATRMRVVMTQNFNLTTACLTNQFNMEVEDYTVIIQPNTLPTVADFTANLNNICTGIVPFFDASTNGATSWTWDFGNGTTSNLQNPVATYSTTVPGNYTVILTACKNGVCSTVTKTNFVNISVPCLTYCTSTGHTNTNQWIGNVTAGATAPINNTTIADVNGYGNYTYLNTAMVLGSTTNPISVTLGNNNGPFTYIAAWIDFNKDGTFQTTERVFNMQANSTSFGAPIIASGTITVPASAQTGTTRMRVVMSNNFNLTTPCLTSQFNMEVEDYTILIQPNTLPPVADFTANLNTVCTGSVQFTDASLNGATSWSWDFGNGTTSTLQNPVATYSTTSPGSYTVILTVCKAGNCNTITKTNFVNINVPCLTYCVSNGHYNTDQWIGNVTTGTINNNSVADANGYGNYTYVNTQAIIGTTNNPISVTLGNNTGPYAYVAVFIDFNKNGVFSATERVFNMQATSTSFGSPLIASGTYAIPATALTGTTRMRVIMSQNFSLTNACVINQFNAETEDYTINLQPNTVPPIVNFSGTPTNTCNGIVNFTDLSQNLPTSWSWNFGDIASGASNTSTLQNPSHTFSAPGLYTITLVATNSFGNNTVIKTNYINYAPNSVACRTITMPVSGTAQTAVTCTGTLVDNGGATGDYSNGVNGVATIAPTGASNVSLTFTSFVTEGGFDYLTIYDGPTTASTPIGTWSGTTLPNNGAPIVSTGNALTVRFSTDGSVTYSGFEATWNCTVNTTPPVANFTASATTVCTPLVNFSDASTNGPTGWSWNFGDLASGGSNTSTLQNPSHSFSAPGLYTITLVATNANGNNTVVKTNYINYDPNNIVCRTHLMPVTGTAPTATTCSGLLFDDGGAANNYSNFANGIITIAPTGATNVALTVSAFNTESGYDHLTIYDGPSTASPVIGTWSGSALPNFGTPIVSTGGALTVRFTSDGSFTLSGFEASWNCTVNTTPPVANFTASATTVCTPLVNFSDASTNSPTGWSWNFGDIASGGNNTSTLQNPSHSFSAPGLYTITLTAINANGNNTVVKTNYINYDPNNIVCRTITMPVSGPDIVTTNCTGLLYDNGGPSANYNNNANGTVVIAPTGAVNVGITFTAFNTEAGYDFVTIYDGPNTSAPVLGLYSGITLPNGGLPIVSTGSALTVRFNSDGIGTFSGFEASWACSTNVGLAKDQNSANFEVYPNPTSGLVNLRLMNTADDDYQVEVTNLLGQSLLVKKISLSDSKEQQLDLSSMAKGVYFIKIRNGKSSGIRKVVLD
jgi:PKD repeat protein